MRFEKEGAKPSSLSSEPTTFPPTSSIRGVVTTCTLLCRIYSAFRRPNVSAIDVRLVREVAKTRSHERRSIPDGNVGSGRNHATTRPIANRPQDAILPYICVRHGAAVVESASCFRKLQNFGDLFGMPRRMRGHPNETLICIEVAERGVGGSQSAQVVKYSLLFVKFTW